MEIPRVSIVIPTCNRPDMLVRALRSVVQQTFKEYEVIVVDDGDTQDAEPCVQKFQHEVMRYIRHTPPRRGAAAARNTGIAAARGEYVAFLDDDDEWVAEKLSRQVDIMNCEKHAGFCVTGARINEDARSYVTHVESGLTDFSDIILTRFKGFLTPSLMVRRTILLDVSGFDESLPSHQELEMMIRITRHHKGYGIDEPLVIVESRSGYEHIGGSMRRRLEGREIVLQKHAALFAKHPRKLAKILFWTGIWYRDIGEGAKAREYFGKAFWLSGNPRFAYHWLRMQMRK